MLKNKKSLIKKLLPHIGEGMLIRVILLQLLSFFSSIIEAISVGAIVPFMAAISSPHKIYNSSNLKWVLKIFEIRNEQQMINLITLLFVLLVVLSAFTKWLLIYLNTKISFTIGSNLAISLYKHTLYQPYLIHTTRNSSEIQSGVTKANELVSLIITPFFLLINSLFTLCLLVGLLIYLNPFIVITSFFSLALFYFIVMISVKNKIKRESEKMNSRRPLLFKSLQEGLGGIRDILLDGSQHIYTEIYRINESKFKQAQAKLILISSTPNIVIQSFGICLIAIFAGKLANNSNFDSTYPFFAALAFGYLRISPALQQIYTSWTNLKTGQNALRYVVNFLNTPLPYYANLKITNPIIFEEKIKLKDISFKYSNDLPNVLNSLNLVINKGERIGIVGSTGSGKSTLIDIIMGLISPEKGELIIDQEIVNETNYRSWQIRIAHVPQMIFLSDNTIIENIAFGEKKDNIDILKIKNAVERAQILDTIENLPDKYNTLIGERGVRLSGGQRQRIGIARALYKNADVIIFDEATSALDNETENDIINSIHNLDKNLTIIFVAHRLTTLKICDCIYELENGILHKHGNYDSFITSKK